MTAFFDLLIHHPGHFILDVAAIVFVFGVIIFVHEGGHFLMAKKSGVKVEQFSFGFGREIFGFTKGETRYTLNWIPLGGFVRMAGEMAEGYEGPAFEGKSTTEISDRDKSREFMAQPWYRRFMIAAAGPIMNYILATFLFTFIFAVRGEPVRQLNETEIGDVIAGKPAELAGLRSGDVVVSINGQAVEDFFALAQKIQALPEKKTAIQIRRDGKDLTINLVPEKDATRGGVGIIGIKPASPIFEYQKISIFKAVKNGLRVCWTASKETILYLADRFVKRQRPDVAGPLGITQIIVTAVKTGWDDFLSLIAMISVAIGLFNFFPIPMLDGGHMLYYGIEGIRGRPLSQKVIGRANMVGLALILSLFVFATFNDIQRLGASHPKAATSETAPNK